jgi:hypothetical protein
MIFRLQVTLQDGKRFAGVGFFSDQGEAINQTWADYPEASSITAICLRGEQP